ncbi:MAG: GNAT family N-acetyltransferase [Acidobacteria bacterium]|nr:GNAT family N-acetyltransferase [Acidobacteriota bacterium]
MEITVAEAPMAVVEALLSVPIAFRVDRVYDVTKQDASGPFILSERLIDSPYIKDYDAISGEGPSQWSRHFELSNWGLIQAHAKGTLVGGAVIAYDTPNVTMLEGRTDLAVLWDIRVSPQFRGQGVGSALFEAAEKWASSRGCRQLKIETQNINVPACRFYARQGCVLGAAHRSAYSQFPDEMQLLWHKDLSVAVIPNPRS